MAKRGKPLPITARVDIRTVRQHQSIRQTARVLGVSPNTVRKYAAKFDTGARKAG